MKRTRRIALMVAVAAVLFGAATAHADEIAPLSGVKEIQTWFAKNAAKRRLLVFVSPT